jgi:hypothetical protein
LRNIVQKEDGECNYMRCIRELRGARIELIQFFQVRPVQGEAQCNRYCVNYVTRSCLGIVVPALLLRAPSALPLRAVLKRGAP